MVDPKTFYVTFDDLLRKIRLGKVGEGFVCSILEEVQRDFGDVLHIERLRLYEEQGDEFVLINKFNSRGKTIVRCIPRDSEAVQLVVEHGNYIFDNQESGGAPAITERSGTGSVPAAIIIRSPEQRWILVLDLRPGWVREEIIFSLNAIRTALNYRLFSEAVHSELEQAAQIQRSLLPPQWPSLKGYEIAGRYQPTEIVGGDLYDFFDFDNDILGVCIGDASGHGLPAALLVRDCVIGMRMGIERHLKMVHSFEKLNNVIYRSTYSSRFVSLFFCEIELDGHVIFVNAGHPAPFVVHGKNVQNLAATGLILGAVPDIKLHRSFANMPPGSVLVLYTDGLFERENREEEAFNIQRLQELVIENQRKSATEIVDVIFNTVFEFGNRGKWEDDTTLVIIKRLPA